MEPQRLEIDGWRAGIRFSACHILPGHSKCSRMHGHTYGVHLRVTGTPGEDGLVTDFTVLKGILREVVEGLDHRMLIPGKDPAMDLLVEEPSIKFRYGDKGYTIPSEDCVLLPLEGISGERLAVYILDRFLEKLGPAPNVSRVELGLDEGPGQGAWAGRDL